MSMLTIGGLCWLCRMPLHLSRHGICSYCLRHLAAPPACPRCGLPSASPDLPCGRCLRQPPPWQALVAVTDFRPPLSHLVHRLKFSHTPELAPVLARLLREKLEALLPASLGTMAEIAGNWRGRVKDQLRSMTERRRFWEKAFSGRFAALVESGQPEQAEQALHDTLTQHQKEGGQVTLVGAGPGDAGLLTLRGLQVMQQADVVLYDHLVSDEILDLVRRDADRICVGKRAGAHSVAQEETNRLLVELALKGKRVVRLKGGDPFIFGRGGEELQAAKAAGIPFQVVPGVTAAAGATAYAGIPLTHRDHAQSVLFITGHCRPDGDAFDWATLARSRQTLAIYMGTVKAAEISAQLIAHGRAADTPAAVIGRGTRADQQVLTGTLAQLDILAQQAPTPALLVIGEVVSLHSQLAWFGHQPQADGFQRPSVVNLA